MTLEDKLRSLTERGKFSHLSLAQTSDGVWRAVFAPSVGSNVHAESDDPVKALLAALSGPPRAKVATDKPTDPHVTDAERDAMSDIANGRC